MSIIKGIFKYAFLLALIGVGVCVIGMAVMMIGGVSIFGYKYFSLNEELSDKVYVNQLSTEQASHIWGEPSSKDGGNTSYKNMVAFNNSYIGDFETIKIVAPHLGVNITNGAWDSLTIGGKISANGFVNTKDIEGYDPEIALAEQVFSVNKPYVKDKTLYITFDVMGGLVNFSSSVVYIGFPTQFRSVKNVIVECDSFSTGYNETFKHSTYYCGKWQKIALPFKVTGTLSVKTTGDQTIKGIASTNISCETEGGDIYIGKLKSVVKATYKKSGEINNVKVVAGSPTIEIPTGTTITEAVTGISGVLSIKNQRGDIDIEKECLLLGGCNIESDYSRVTMGTVGADWRATSGAPTFSYKGLAGYLTLTSVYGVVELDTPNAVLNIDSIKKSLDSMGELNVIDGKAFSLNIKEIVGSTVSVVTESGSVSIGTLESDRTDITTKSGNVTIDKLYSSAKVITDNGNITVTQDTTARYKDAYKSAVLDCTTAKGNVVLNDISSAVKLKTTKMAYAKVRFANIQANSTFDNADGELEVALPYQRAVLVTKGAGTAKVSISNIEYSKKNQTMISYLNVASSEVNVVGTSSDPTLNTYIDTTTGKALNMIIVSTSSGTATITNLVK